MNDPHRRILFVGRALALLLAVCLLSAAGRPGISLEVQLPPAEPSAVSAEVIPEPVVQAALAGITEAEVTALNGRLSGEQPVEVGGESYLIQTRYSLAALPMQQVTRYAYEQFERLGLATEYFTYTLPLADGPRRNVIAEQPGVSDPDRVYLITAHLDSRSGDPFNLAPGADDNASGSSAVLIAAETLSRLRFDYTLRYVLFTGEEQGLVGSTAYAEALFAAGEDLAGVINLDMIGYNSDPIPIIDLHARNDNPGSQALAELFRDTVAAYGLDLEPEILVNEPLGFYSDNAPFWTRGYPAILAIEDYDDFTPYIHTISDTLSTLDPTYYTEFVKAGAATLAHLGGLNENGSLEGRVIAADSWTPVPGALVRAIPQAGESFTTSSAADGSYALVLPGGSYTVTVSAEGYLPFTEQNVETLRGTRAAMDFVLFEAAPCTPLDGLELEIYPPAPYVDQTVTFSATLEEGSPPVVYVWDFGDGSQPVAGTTQVVEHRFPALAEDAAYSVQVTAENACTADLQVERPLAVRARKSFLPALHGFRP